MFLLNHKSLSCLLLEYLSLHDIIIEGENLKIKKKVKQEDYTGDIIFELWRDALEKSFFYIYIYWRSYWGLKSKVERTFSYIKVTFRTACMLNPDSNRK